MCSCISSKGLKRIALSYPGNLGFVEMMQFQDDATPEQKELMDHLLNYEEWEQAWTLLQEVTHTNLQD
ncbi:MAG: hypothetical protein DRJ03_24345 [Chloroflexi bacterium]|nr:MAG: hypothetical protein DRJ03_24345 [Chloroflexota bacterium]